MIPLFKSHYSIGKSILTLEKSGGEDKNYPHSIINIAKKHSLKSVVLVDDCFSGFLEAYQNLKEIGCKLIFGIKFTFTEKIEDKTEESLKKEHKIILMAKNNQGYKKLIKLYTLAATKGFYYVPRLDFSSIKEMWSDADLEMWVPFYDSYIYNNLFLDYSCIPNFNTKPLYIIEDNLLPIDIPLQKHLESLTEKKFLAKSIYYYNRSDFVKYLTRRCIDNRTSLDKPRLEGLSSNEFCFESYLNYVSNKTKNV